MRLFTKKQKPTPPAPNVEIGRWANAPPRRNTTRTLDAYKELPRLATVIDAVADGAAEVEWTLTYNGKPVANHPLLTLLEDPNDHQTGSELIHLISIHLDLVGEAYLLIKDTATIPTTLWPIVPDQITNLPDYSQPPDQQFYTVTTGKGSIQIPASDIIAIKRADPRNPLGRGVGLAQALGDELDTNEYAASFIKNLLYNNALPSAVIGIESDNPNVESLKAFAESLKQRYGGPQNAGRVLITEGKTTVSRLDTPLKDMGLVDLTGRLNDFIRQTFKVPPEIIGDLASSNRATVFAARENLALAAVQPRIRQIRNALQKKLSKRYGGSLTLGFKRVIPSDKDRQLAVFQAMPQAFSYDEWRALADLDPDPQRPGYPLPMPGSKPESALSAEPKPKAKPEEQ